MRLLLVGMIGSGWPRYGVDEEGFWWRSWYTRHNWQRVDAFRVPRDVKEDFMSVSPSLDYLHGYNVRRVLVPQDGDEAHHWGIEFHNGAIVYNDDPDLLPPNEQVGVGSEIKGLSLITTLYGAADTRLRLGRVETRNGEQVVVDDVMVTFTPGHYTIIDPRFEGIPFTPQAGNAEQPAPDELPPDEQTIRDQFNARNQ